MKKIKIELEEIDLSKGEEHTCPGLNTKDEYLVLRDGVFAAGQFNKVWYGLNFIGFPFYDAGIQYDTPGTNCSDWQQVWRIVRKRRMKNARNKKESTKG